MQFDPTTRKVNPDKLTRDEARILVLFLISEVMRHQDDIDETTKLITRMRRKFNFSAAE